MFTVSTEEFACLKYFHEVKIGSQPIYNKQLNETDRFKKFKNNNKKKKNQKK